MIEQLKIHQLRNLSSLTIAPKSYNLIVGDNGSGKTSLLEAVFLLSRGKTFRHHEPRRYISHHGKTCAVWAKTTHNTLAVQKQLNHKNLASSVLKFNEQVVVSQSVLSFVLPVVLIDPSGMTLLEEGSHGRRQLLDWLVFHMEPSFYDEWLAYQRLLKHRNGLLKMPNIGHHHRQIGAWDYQLAQYATSLHAYRQAVFADWLVFFWQMVGQLLPAYADRLELSYQAGFDVATGLLASLQQRLAMDVELGYTRVGAHRADMSVFVKKCHLNATGKEQAAHVLSRGEKKLLIVALKLSQLQLLCSRLSWGVVPVVLIDDIDAELDSKAIDVLLETLLSLPCQLFMTSLNPQLDSLVQQKIANKCLDGRDYQLLWLGDGRLLE